MSKNNDGLKALLIPLGWILLIGLGWLALGSTTWLAIDIKACEPEGLIGQSRAAIQGHSFYVDQTKVLDAKMAKMSEELNKNWGMPPEFENEIKKLEAQTEMLEAQNDAAIASVTPELATTAEEKAARKLRKTADELEARAESKRAYALLFRAHRQFAECRAKISQY